MSTKTQVILTVILLVAAFATGRWLAPTKIKTVTEVIEVEKKTKDTQVHEDTEIHKTTTVTETVKPNGEKVITTVITEDTDSNKDSHMIEKDKTLVKNTESKETTRDNASVNISLLVGTEVSFGSGVDFGPKAIGAYISKPILGPITVGLFGLSNGTAGVAVGIQL